MDPDQQKEQFSNAYVRAVAAAAGFAVSEPSVDDDSIDIQFIAGPDVGRARLEAQLKCTEAVDASGDQFSYPLKIKNYEDLRATNLLVPRILIVVVVPSDVGDWVSATTDELAMRRCGYWASLRGEPATSNEYTVSVPLPTGQCLHPTGLTGLMTAISNGQVP